VLLIRLFVTDDDYFSLWILFNYNGIHKLDNILTISPLVHAQNVFLVRDIPFSFAHMPQQNVCGLQQQNIFSLPK